MTWLKERTTEKIKKIVATAIDKMPHDATNIRLVEGYRHSVGALGTHNSWTEVEAIYKNDEGEVVGRERTIDKHGGWQYSNPANYVLYSFDLFVPYDDNDLKHMKQCYEDDLNRGAIYPINNVYSSEYLMAMKVKEMICEEEEVDLTFKLDYESDIWGTKFTKPCDYRIILGDFITEPLSEYNAYYLFVNTFDELVDNGIKVNAHIEMKEEHKKRLDHWRWREEIQF